MSEKIDVENVSGDCSRCRKRKITNARARIEAERAELAEWSRENGCDYLEELRAKMRAEGYDY